MRASSVAAWRSNSASTSASKPFSPKVMRLRWGRSMIAAADASARPAKDPRSRSLDVSSGAELPAHPRNLQLEAFVPAWDISRSDLLLLPALIQAGRQPPRRGKRQLARSKRPRLGLRHGYRRPAAGKDGRLGEWGGASNSTRAGKWQRTGPRRRPHFRGPRQGSDPGTRPDSIQSCSLIVSGCFGRRKAAVHR
jgi:hypothetical protein